MKLRRVTFVCLAAGIGGAAAVAGCSSSSNPDTTPAANTPGADASSQVGSVDGGGDAGVTLQWAVQELMSTVYVSDGGGADLDASGASDTGATDAGTGDTGTTDASDDASTGSLGNGTVDASADATVTAGDAAASDDGGDDGGGISSLPPLPGVSVCVYQNSAIPCTTTGSDGTFTMPHLPVRAQLVLALKKDGYQSILLPIETASTDMDGRSNPLYMNPPGVPANLGVTVDLQNKGMINAFAVQLTGANADQLANVPGTSVALVPSNGNGPYYVDNGGSVELTSTSFTATTALYYNIDPGTYTLTYTTTSTFDCEPISFPFGQFGFPVTSPAHSLKIVVAAGYMTGIVGTLCTASAKVVAVDGG
jgi:hypothetical protein